MYRGLSFFLSYSHTVPPYLLTYVLLAVLYFLPTYYEYGNSAVEPNYVSACNNRFLLMR